MSSRQSGKKCVINSCKVSKRNTSKKLFKYPKNGMEMYKKWLETCNLESCTIKNFYICEQHFLPTDLGKKYLKKHTFPRISQCVECIQEVSQDNPLMNLPLIHAQLLMKITYSIVALLIRTTGNFFWVVQLKKYLSFSILWKRTLKIYRKTVYEANTT